MISAMEAAQAPEPRSLRVLRTALLVLVIFLIAAIVVWIVDGSGGGSGSEEAAEVPAPAGAARIVSPAGLREAAAARGGPLYWAGERAGAKLELSEPARSRAYVRYLTGDAAAGDPKASFLAIGTYEVPHALEGLQADAKRSGGKLRRAPHGLSAWQDPRSPTSVYLAKPGGEFQVEVYDPSPKTAREVALSAQLRQVR